MAEIATADSSGGSTVTVKSPQTNPTSKSDSDKGSESTEPSSEQPRRVSKITSKAKGPERNERGVVKTVWDDPNKRKHIGESPDGDGNVIEGH